MSLQTGIEICEDTAVGFTWNWANVNRSWNDSAKNSLWASHHSEFLSKLVKYYSNSNKSPTRYNNFSSLLSWRLFTAQYVSGVLTPVIRSPTTAVAASGFAFISWWEQCCWSWSGPRARPRPTAVISPRYDGKTRGCYCSCWAPDDGRVDARNMLSCK